MKALRNIISILTVTFFIIQNAQAQANDDIEKIIFAYQEALNSSDVDKVVQLYTEDGIFLPNAGPTAIGIEQVKGTYKYVFQNLKLNLEFTIIEIEVNDNYAYVRSTSKGTVLNKTSGETIADENRELFIFKKELSAWKVYRYMFNKTL